MPTLTVQAIADNWLDQYNNLANNGHDSMLHIATGGVYPVSRRPILRFDFTALPGGAVISAATLSLCFLRAQVGDPFGRTYWAYRLTQMNWDEYWSSWSILDNSTEPELVMNGGFATDTNGWSAIYGTLSSIAGGRVGNCLQITRVEDAYQSAYQTLSLVNGKQYRLCGWVKSGTSGNERFIVAIGDYGVTGSYFNILGSTTGFDWTYYEGTFIADSTKPNWNKLSLVKESPTAGTMLFDEISVELTEYLYWSVATDSTGVTDGLTATITGMTDTSDFYVGDFVTVKRITSTGFVSDVFPSIPLWIVSKTATTVVLNIVSSSAQVNVIVTKVTSGGGNYTQVSGASVVMPYHKLGTPGWVNWNVLAMVQYFQSSGGEIADFLLKDGNESSGPIGACFYSRKDPHTTLWPKLEIVY